jgi:large subunit ribosomal protein L3e
MSHRKFEHPRCGSLGFLPRKRAARMRGRIKKFPEDDASLKPHFTAFVGFKAGMTHVVRDYERTDVKWMKNKEVCEPVTILETPPLIVVGVVGLVKTPFGLRTLKTVWATHLSESCRRRFYKHWVASKKKAFTHYVADENEKCRKAALASIAKYAHVVRAIVHTQPDRVRLGPKKASILEVQVNGGTAQQKIDFITSKFEQEIKVSDVFQQGEIIDTVAVNKGHGFEGVVHRWGVTRLPRKTHRGLRKVACIGAWHPARVRYTVARAGQNGCHHRTEINKKIYEVRPKDYAFDTTRPHADYTQKPLTPMGGFVWYGPVNEDSLMIKGSITGPRKRLITLRRSLRNPTRKWMLEKVSVKFIDTSSKLGHGRFQTSEEKRRFFGPLKKDLTETVEA